MKFLLFLTTIMFLSVGSAKAESKIFELDKAHTQILFFVDHLGFSTSQGEFHDYDATFEFNQTEPEKSKIDVVIQTSSIDMDDEKWNDHLKNPDFFDVEKFPTMTFKSTKIEKTGENTGLLHGDLTILETTKPVTLDVVFNKADIHPFSKKFTAGFSATTKIKRSDYNMNYGLPMIGDEVDIMIELEANRKDENVSE